MFRVRRIVELHNSELPSATRHFEGAVISSESR
jgi:hypothetical protein